MLAGEKGWHGTRLSSLVFDLLHGVSRNPSKEGKTRILAVVLTPQTATLTSRRRGLDRTEASPKRR
jgi:hypothetical protein